MQTTRSRSSQLKKASIKTSKQPSQLPKLFGKIDSLYHQLSQTPKISSSNNLEQNISKIEQYKSKILKHSSTKEFGIYLSRLAHCQKLLANFRRHYQSEFSSNQRDSRSHSNHTLEDESSCTNQYKSTQMDLLRHTVQSKQSILKQLYEKQKQKASSYQVVIKQQQREMQLFKKRLDDLEIKNKKQSRQFINSSKENLDNNISRMQQTVKDKLSNRISQMESYRMQRTQKTQRAWKNQNMRNFYGIQSSEVSTNRLKVQELQLQIICLQKQNSSILSSHKNIQSNLKQKQIFCQKLQVEVDSLKEQLKIKQQILQQLLYQKQNYSDAYVKLKEENAELLEKLETNEQKLQRMQKQIGKSQEHISQIEEEKQHILRLKQEEIEELQQMIHQLNEELLRDKQKAEITKLTLDSADERTNRANARTKHIEDENKQLKLKLRTAEHKTEIYMQKYYKLQNQNLQKTQRSDSGRFIAERDRTNRSFERGDKLVTAHTYQISVDRSDRKREMSNKQRQTNRKMKVLSQIKNMVRERRNNLFD